MYYLLFCCPPSTVHIHKQLWKLNRQNGRIMEENNNNTKNIVNRQTMLG
uniref:Uncharacterized protein n=1 Tax=Meloidogyne enterolobii TaxID=390850 RepID=A0A6V7U5R2_MELEN|nr:unnamed protein product [Meloidogyne enterolobii]